MKERISLLPNWQYKVLVKCFTYNQSKYIEDALRGFVMQETNFPYICFIVDDASTDGEQNVINNYLELHFACEDKSSYRTIETEDYVLKFARHKTNHNCFFATLFLKYNHYSIKKNKDVYFAQYIEKVKYIALCEGDDYWINKYKLQRQVELLDSDSNCSLCYHACKNVFEDNYKGVKSPIGEFVKEKLSYIDFMPGYPFQTASVVYRSSVHKSPLYIKVKAKGSMYSVSLFITVGQFGYFRGFKEQMSVYRRNGGGISVANKVDVQKSFIKKQILICGFYTPEVKKQIINKSILPNLLWLYSKSKREFMQMAFLSFKNHPSIIFSLVRVFIVLFSKKILRYVGLPFVTI